MLLVAKIIDRESLEVTRGQQSNNEGLHKFQNQEFKLRGQHTHGA